MNSCYKNISSEIIRQVIKSIVTNVVHSQQIKVEVIDVDDFFSKIPSLRNNIDVNLFSNLLKNLKKEKTQRLISQEFRKKKTKTNKQTNRLNTLVLNNTSLIQNRYIILKFLYTVSLLINQFNLRFKTHKKKYSRTSNFQQLFSKK